MVASLSRVEALRSLDRDFLELPDLANELLLPGQLGSLLILHTFSGVVKILSNFVANLTVFVMFVSDSVVGFLVLVVDRFDHILVFLEILSELVLTLTQQNVYLTLNLRSETVIDLDLLLAS